MLLGILIVIALWDISKSAVRNARSGAPSGSSASARSSPGRSGRSASSGVRQRRAGYWVREGLGGFPAARTGWHAGWLAHKTVLDQQRNIRETARTNHLETKRDTAASIREHRKRQAEALREIEDELAAQQAKGSPATGRKAVRQARDEVARKRLEREQTAGGRCPSCGAPDGYDHLPGCDPAAPPLPADSVRPAPSAGASGEPDDYKRVPCPDCEYVPGRPPVPIHQPETADDERHAAIDDAVIGADHGFEGEYDTHPSPTTEGAPVTADTNYKSALANAKAFAAECDNAATEATARRTRAEQDVEGMQALDVDGATTSSAMDMLEQLQAAEKASQAASDHAGAYADGLQKRHGGIDAAVDDAPVDRPAHRDFYGQG